MTDKPVAAERKDPESQAGDAPRHDTGEMPVTREAMRKAFRINEIWTFLVSSMLAVSAIFGAYKLALSEARAAGAEGASSAQKATDDNTSSIKRMQAEFTEHVQTESAARVRMEKKLNALLDKLDVPDPAPTPKDGGQ